MCGITGWAFAPPDEGRLQRALLSLSHRGPDGAGMWAGEDVALGHRRLAIIDLSSRADQPMANQDGSVRLVFNGEIYNFKKLRNELQRDFTFKSDSDTEVIVHGYTAWGIGGLVERLAGMFAFALWDGPRRVLHLARDRVGKKPLYYAKPGRALLFGSTLPSLLELLPERPRIRPDALADYLHYQCVPGDKSLLEGIHKLLPGHFASYDGSQLQIERYWRLSFARQEQHSDQDWVDQIEHELREATACRLVADVPVGVFLSGGVDSSLVTATAVEAAGGRVTTISAGFEQTAFDELRWARMVAQRLGTDHHEHVVRPDATSDLPWLVHAAGEPQADPALLPTMYLSRAARQSVTVVLTGDGGDEAFAGYPAPVIAGAAAVYQRAVPSGLREDFMPQRFSELAGRGGLIGRYARRLRRVAEAARGSFTWRFDMLAEKGFRGRLGEVLHPCLRAPLAAYDPDEHWDRAFRETDGPTPIDRVLQLELATQLPDLFLTKIDMASMAYGLEARSPFLDVSLLELSARVPARMKLKGWRSKALLKQLLLKKHPSREAVLRRKQGFSVPISDWLRGPLAGVTERALLKSLTGRELVALGPVQQLLQEHRSGVKDHGQRLWSLLILELWLQMFVDGTLKPHDRLEA
jgi:asparagine synthase (glutamine-hydrolysing)